MPTVQSIDMYPSELISRAIQAWRQQAGPNEREPDPGKCRYTDRGDQTAEVELRDSQGSELARVTMRVTGGSNVSDVQMSKKQ